MAAVLVLAACGRNGKGSGPADLETTASNGAISPAGDKHPGEIVHEDKADNRTWTRHAAEVPMSIAWVTVDGKWVPVVRIEISGTIERRTMTAYGPKGRFLQRSVQGPPAR